MDSTATRARSVLPSSLLLTLFDTVSVGGPRELSVTQLVAFVSLTFVSQVILLVQIASTIVRFQLPASLRRLIQLEKEIRIRDGRFGGDVSCLRFGTIGS